MNTTDKGQWGDIFGAANALFSGLAFVLIYHGIKVQRYEVEIAKRELEESKQQTKDQKAALDKQNEATERQIFESFVFKTLEILQNEATNFFYIKEDMKYGVKEYKGRICLKVSLNEDKIGALFKMNKIEEIARVFANGLQNENNDYLNYIEMSCNIINFTFEDSNSRDTFYDRSFAENYVKQYFTSYELVHIGLMCALLSPITFPYIPMTQKIIEQNGLFRKLKKEGPLINILLAKFDKSAWDGRI